MCANNVSFNSVADSHEERGEFMTSWFMSYEFILSSARWCGTVIVLKLKY
jgi:hypothetical protein